MGKVIADLATSAASATFAVENATSSVDYIISGTDGSANDHLKTDGSGNLAWVAPPAGGLTYASQWRLNTNLSVSGVAPGTNIAANWELPESTDFPGVIGSGSPMVINASTGAWAFPATGVWYVALTVESDAVGSAHESGRFIYTTDSTGSSWEQAAFTNHTHAQYAVIPTRVEWLMKVANTTTDLVRFSAGTTANTDDVYGDTNSNRTYATFIKLGDAS
jgi:hypothetical protein